MSAASLALEVAALTDGERALQILVEERSASLWSWIYWRFWKDSGTLRTSSHSEGSLEAEVWVLDRAPCESCCEVSQVVKGIRQSVTKRRIFGAKRKTLRGVANYLYRNRLRIMTNIWPKAGP